MRGVGRLQTSLREGSSSPAFPLTTFTCTLMLQVAAHRQQAHPQGWRASPLQALELVL